MPDRETVIDYAIVLVLSVIVVTVILVMSPTDNRGAPALYTVQGEISVPAGYTFVDASAYGRFFETVTYYCRQDGTDRVFVCTGGQIGAEVILPDGYEFAGASDYGEFFSNTTYYCRQRTTGRVYICRPQQ